MAYINTLWNSGKEYEWYSALDNYWKHVKPTHFAIEKEFDSLNTNTVKEMNSEEWYEFLLQKYFYWKYTAPNRYATTTAQLKKCKITPDGFKKLFSIKQKIFDFDKEDIVSGLKIACSIKGLGTAGASGLLAVLFPIHFATVDQFAVKSLLGIDNLPEKTSISSMNPEQLKIKDAVILIDIMKHKAKELNNKFMTSFWTPRKIDMILWSVHR
jgi:hypothetical protein